MKKQFGDTKKLSLDYMGKSHLSIDGFLSYDKLPSGEETLSINGLPSMEGVKIVSNDSSNDITGEANGHAVLEVDTSITKISSVISLLEKEVEIKDISIIDSSIDEVVVNLYKQYEI
jgi:hypothetical protein